MWWWCLCYICAMYMIFILYLNVAVYNLYICILLSINCMCIAGSTKSCIIQANSVAHWKPILWRTLFCGAPRNKCATETLILWRMGRCATETLFLWRSFCGAPPMRHRIHFWCATDEAFPTSVGPLTKAMIHGGSFSFGHISSISYENNNCCHMLMH